MLMIKIDGKPIEISNDFSITMNLKSPIFNEPGSYSYPFKIPNSPRNKIQLGFRHRISNTNSIFHEFSGALLWKGINLFTGTMKIKLVNDESYEGYLMEGNGDFNYQRKKNTLQDVDFGQLSFSWDEFRNLYINDCAGRIYPERNVAFPQILNKSYFETTPTEPHLLYFNYYENGAIYPPYFPNYQHTGVVVPMLYLRYVLKKIFEHLRYTLQDDFFTSDPEYNSLALFNAVDCNSGTAGFFSYSKLLLLYNYHVPRMDMNAFFQGIETMFNIRLFVNNHSRTVTIKSVDNIVKDPDCIELSQNTLSISTEPEDQIKGFHLKMEMDTEDEYYTGTKALQNELLKHLKSSVQSLVQLNPWPASDYLDTRFVHEKDEFYILGYNGQWAPVSSMYWTWNLFSEWVYKDDDQQLNTSFSTLVSKDVHPYDGVIGNARDDWKEIAPKLFFVHYIDNGGNDKRVIARCFTDNNNLFYGGEFGLMNKHYKTWCDFRMSTKLVKIVKNMSFSELQSFDFSKKYMINGVKYLIKNIQVVIKRDRIMPATLECYPCP